MLWGPLPYPLGPCKGPCVWAKQSLGSLPAALARMSRLPLRHWSPCRPAWALERRQRCPPCAQPWIRHSGGWRPSLQAKGTCPRLRRSLSPSRVWIPAFTVYTACSLCSLQYVMTRASHASNAYFRGFVTCHYNFMNPCRVLIHAAAGGVGLAAIQLLQCLRATVIATAGAPAKRRMLRSVPGIPECLAYGIDMCSAQYITLQCCAPSFIFNLHDWC